MVTEPDRELIGAIFRGLEGTFLEGQLILGGSSGLFGFPTTAPAFTEDLDFLVREDLVVGRGAEIVRLIQSLGYERTPDSPTFSASGRPSFDLVGYSATDCTDHLSPTGALQVMVFGDLGIILGEAGSVERYPNGGLVLSPPGFCAVKLTTVRVEKGSKDKIQALLVIAERSSEKQFCEALVRILNRFDVERRNDALADAQMAFLSLQLDPAFKDHGAEGYAGFLQRVEQGYRALNGILGGRLHG